MERYRRTLGPLERGRGMFAGRVGLGRAMVSGWDNNTFRTPYFSLTPATLLGGSGWLCMSR